MPEMLSQQEDLRKIQLPFAVPRYPNAGAIVIAYNVLFMARALQPAIDDFFCRHLPNGHVLRRAGHEICSHAFLDGGDALFKPVVPEGGSARSHVPAMLGRLLGGDIGHLQGRQSPGTPVIIDIAEDTLLDITRRFIFYDRTR